MNNSDAASTTSSFREKFIGFVDILGFKNMVMDAEAGRGIPLDEILAAGRDLGSEQDRERYERYGPTLCPQAPKMAADVDFQITRISDSLLVSTEISPAGVIGLVQHCWMACFKLLSKGILCRGFITRGRIFHHGDEFVGSGYHSALDGEKNVSIFKILASEKSTPFIEVDQEVVRYVADQNDACVKKMFERLTASDGTLTAIFPFKRLNQSFLVDKNFNADRQLESLSNVRSWIRDMKAKIAPLINQGDSSAVAKGAHYFRMLDVQLVECDKTEGRIQAWRRALAQSPRLTDPRVGTPTDKA